MLRFTNKENNYFTPVIKHFVGSEKWEEEGCEKIKTEIIEGIIVDGCAPALCGRV